MPVQQEATTGLEADVDASQHEPSSGAALLPATSLSTEASGNAMSSFSSPPRRQRGDGSGQNSGAAPLPPPPTTPSGMSVPPDESKISSPLISVSIRDDDKNSPHRSSSSIRLAAKARFPASGSGEETRPAEASSLVATSTASQVAANPPGSGPISPARHDSNKKRPVSRIAPPPGNPDPVRHASQSGPNNVNYPFSSQVHSYHHPHHRGAQQHGPATATKRPYIRTKRPKNYSDKSTITSTTDALYESTIHPYDAVLAEAQSLLAAASEAQQLGRVKMASTYLLLLHARLVGLGRRFDKASIAGGSDANDSEANGHSSNSNQNGDDSHGDAHTTINKNDGPANESSAVPSIADSLLTPKSRAVKEFTKLLPKDIEMDQSMMEHLAKAAVELHAARSKKHRDPKLPPVTSQQQLQQHPKGLYVADTSAFLAATANQQGIATAATRAVTASSGTRAERKSVASGIAWTDDEIQILNRNRADSLSSDQLASLLPGRTEQQVKTYLKNHNARQRVQLETMESLNDHAVRQHHHHPPPARSSPIDKSAAPLSTSQQVSLNVAASGVADTSPPIRVRKPATAAFYTAPNAICDARTLLSHVRQQAVSHQEEQAATPPNSHHPTPSKSSA